MKIDWRLMGAALIALIAASWIGDIVANLSGGMVGSPVNVSIQGTLQSILGIVIFLVLFIALLRWVRPIVGASKA